MSGHKAGIAGVVLMIGMLFARVGDNCAGVAGRSARLASEGSVLDDVARVGRRADDFGEFRPPLLHGAGRPVAEFGVDLTVELVRMDPDEFPGVQSAGPTRCPRVVDLTTPSAWDALTGKRGLACAPVIVTGLTRAPGTMLLRLADQPVRELAQDCTIAGSVCVFVGCAPEAGAECLAATAASLKAMNVHERLAPFVAEFVERALKQAPRPAFLAQLVSDAGRLRLHVTEPRPAADVDPPPNQ